MKSLLKRGETGWGDSYQVSDHKAWLYRFRSF